MGGRNELHLGKFEKRRPPLFKVIAVLYIKMSFTQLSWKIILSCYVAVIFQMKDLLCQFDVWNSELTKLPTIA